MVKIKERLQLNWLWSTVFLVVLFITINNFAPNEPIDPWGLFHLKKIGFIFFAISIVQYLCFFLVKFLGGHVGMVLSGFFGGIVSSTAVTISSAHLSQDHGHLQRLPAAAVISATIAMVFEVMLILFIGSPELYSHVSISLMVMMGTGVVAILILFQKGKSHYDIPIPQNPLDLFEIFIFTTMIVFLIFLVGLGKIYLGEVGVKLVSFAASLFEVHGVVAANAQLFSLGKISEEEGHQLVMLSLFAASLSKLAISWWVGSQRFALMVSTAILAMLLSGFIIYALF